MQKEYNKDGLSYSPAPAPKQTDYECDVLVIGGGYAGLMAAVTAREAGKSVVLVDKGKPGYSGLSPYVDSMRWYEPEWDEADTIRKRYLRSSQYMGNRNWINVWLEDSKKAYEKLSELGILERYDGSGKDGYWSSDEYVKFREKTAKYDRHPAFMRALLSKNVTVVCHTMVYDVVKQGNRVVGAVGFHVPTGTQMTFHAQATILCMGGGVYKPAGWPTGGISYDAVAIAYDLGLPVIGQEFEDFHVSNNDAPTNAFLPNVNAFLEPVLFTGGEIREDRYHELVPTSRSTIRRANWALNGSAPWEAADGNAFQFSKTYGSVNMLGRPDSKKSFIPRGAVTGCAAGFGMHTTNGIYCGDQDTHGDTGIPGLYCAGDGCNGGPVGGSTYPGGGGFTSNFVSVQGMRSAQAACEYADTVKRERIEQSRIHEIAEEMFRPLKLETGFSANWALDCLQGIMAPYWTILLKNEACLQAALTQVTYMRDHVIPKLQAMDSHDLRYCIEMRHKILEAEMKLRASLARKESRGAHYRTDYPYRDDENFLCYFGLVKGKNGNMEVVRIDYPDEWKGDRTESYRDRYRESEFFPGEEEAIAAKGLG